MKAAEASPAKVLSGTSRIARVIKTAAASVLERGLTILIGLVTVPLSLSYLGSAQYGLWATITSFVGLFSFADLGIGFGVMNAVAAASGSDDRTGIRRAISNGLALLSIAGLLVLLVFAISYPFVHWDSVLGVPDQGLAGTAALAMVVLTVLFALNIPLGLIQRIQYGLQQGYLNSVIQVTGSVMGLALIFAVIHLDLGLVGMVSVFLLAPMLATVVVAGYMLKRTPYIRPSLGLVTRPEMKTLFGTGAMFFVIQMSASLAFASDNLIIAQVIGPEQVASYAVHQKLFSPVQAAVGFIMTPLWPAYTEAISRGDITWVKKVLARSAAILGVGALVGTLLLLWQSDTLMKFWLRGRIDADLALCVALTVWLCIESTAKAFSMFLNGAGILKEQLYITIVFVPLCLGLKVLFASWWGTPGIVYATALSWFITHVPSYYWIIRRWFEKQRHQPAPAAAGA